MPIAVEAHTNLAYWVQCFNRKSSAYYNRFSSPCRARKKPWAGGIYGGAASFHVLGLLANTLHIDKNDTVTE